MYKPLANATARAPAADNAAVMAAAAASASLAPSSLETSLFLKNYKIIVVPGEKNLNTQLTRFVQYLILVVVVAAVPLTGCSRGADAEEERWDRPADRSARLYDRAFDRHDSADYRTNCCSIVVCLRE